MWHRMSVGRTEERNIGEVKKRCPRAVHRAPMGALVVLRVRCFPQFITGDRVQQLEPSLPTEMADSATDIYRFMHL
jgi:hypothetical protein